MKFRHEWKHTITALDRLVLRARLAAVARPDGNGNAGTYEIRSLYFDDPQDSALREKIDGVNLREKFRIRYYNGDPSFIRLEKKSKLNGLCCKESEGWTAEETAALLAGDAAWMLQSERPLTKELYTKMKLKGLQPKTVVDYIREAFVFPAGNVRITLDYRIRTGSPSGFLAPESLSLPVEGDPILLEVKWDEYLPDIIRDAVQLEGRRSCAFSKYAACRVYG
ncbi:MAG: polyphosphate polymerase domain-containing protein [Provencibacterium sp.]|nr:polyphosphate polymerase domain-containing protein [Provencibacterium sp.]